MYPEKFILQMSSYPQEFLNLCLVHLPFLSLGEQGYPRSSLIHLLEKKYTSYLDSNAHDTDLKFEFLLNVAE